MTGFKEIPKQRFPTTLACCRVVLDLCEYGAFDEQCSGEHVAFHVSSACVRVCVFERKSNQIEADNKQLLEHSERRLW